MNQNQTYLLLSRLFAHGLTEEDLEAVRRIDALSNHIPEPFDPDAAAADHQHIFGFNIFAFESVFLDPSGQLGGAVENSTIRDYQRAGFEVNPTAGAADHIAHQLEYLGFLSRTETRAQEEDRQTQVAQTRKYRRAFLDTHLLRWLPPLVLAVRNQNHPFYTSLVEVAMETITNDWMTQDEPAESTFTLPEPPDLLGNEGTGLKEIAVYLLTPAYSGIYLSRDDIGRLARDQSVPRGFGERRQMLTNLMRAVAVYGETELVLSSLQLLVENWVESFREMEARSESVPTTVTWIKRAVETTTIIARMRSRLSDTG
jgi:TorA maturation chaperone TorD